MPKKRIRTGERAGTQMSREELLTAATPQERLRTLLVGIGQRIVVWGHTHAQFDHTVDGSVW
ncbi:MAG TPA: hypothetical protein VFV38_00085 [Ktedonobacteraceae bacterium]|nr:hypothetical protein [Ktedonobacteraceae bacterium]